MWFGSWATADQHGSPPSGCGSTSDPVIGAGQSLPVRTPNMSHCSLSGDPPWLGSQSGLFGAISQRANSGSFGGCAATLAPAGAAPRASAAASAERIATTRALPTAQLTPLPAAAG